ncbi:hypothetical protein PATA110615_18955 [Paenibacillus taichungensis]
MKTNPKFVYTYRLVGIPLSLNVVPLLNCFATCYNKPLIMWNEKTMKFYHTMIKYVRYIHCYEFGDFYGGGGLDCEVFETVVYDNYLVTSR